MLSYNDDSLLFQTNSTTESIEDRCENQSTELTTTPSEIACLIQIDQLQQQKLNQSIELYETSLKLDKVSKECNLTLGDDLDNTDEKIKYWVNKSDSYKDELVSCKKEVKLLSVKIQDMEQIQKSKDEHEEVWQKAWAKHDHRMCVRACDLMRTAACKMAFGLLSFRSNILDC